MEIPLPTPLSESDIANTLTAVRVVVQVDASRELMNGQTFTASAEQTVMLRNLVINR